MGCWNSTCAITNLPIHNGEEVYVFLLEGKKSYPGAQDHCYCTSYYTPLLYHFTGTYDDYGGVENCHGLMLDDIIENVKSNLFELEQGPNRFHDIPVEKAGFNVETLFEVDHKGRLFVIGHDNEPVKLTHIQIKKSVLDKFISDFVFQTYHFNKKGKLIEDRITMKSVLSGVETLRQEFLNVETGSLLDVCSQLIILGGDEGEELDIKKILKTYFNICVGVYTFMDDLKKNVNDSEKFRELLFQVTVYVFLNRFFEMGRKVWIKPSGEGSQNTDTYSQKLTCKLISHGIAKDKERFEDDH